MAGRMSVKPRCHVAVYLSLSYGEFTNTSFHIMLQLAFTYVSVQGWVINSNKEGFFHSNHISGCHKNNSHNGTTQGISTATSMTLSTDKLLKNLSRPLLTKVQVSLLVHGLSFTITPRHPPHGECITTMEQDCLSLEPYEAEGLTAEIWGALKCSYTPLPTIIKEEIGTLREI